MDYTEMGIGGLIQGKALQCLMQHYLGEDKPDSALLPTGDIDHAAVVFRGARLRSDYTRPDSSQCVTSRGQ